MYRFLPLFFLPLAALAADELPGVVVPKKPVGGLYDTCAIQVVQLSKGEKAWVTGNCSTRHGDQMESHLDLDRCFSSQFTFDITPEKEYVGRFQSVNRCVNNLNNFS